MFILFALLWVLISTYKDITNFLMHKTILYKLLISLLKVYREKPLFCGNFVLGFLQIFLRKIDENQGYFGENYGFGEWSLWKNGKKQRKNKIKQRNNFLKSRNNSQKIISFIIR